MGRPSIRTKEMTDSICERLSRGEPLAAICRDEGMPTDRTVREWAQNDPALSSDIAHAREAGEDWLAAECLAISDTPCLGVIEKHEPDKDGNLVLTERREEDMLGHRKLQIETRLKLLAKWNPKKYGERLDVKASVTLETLLEQSRQGGD